MHGKQYYPDFGWNRMIKIGIDRTHVRGRILSQIRLLSSSFKVFLNIFFSYCVPEFTVMKWVTPLWETSPTAIDAIFYRTGGHHNFLIFKIKSLDNFVEKYKYKNQCKQFFGWGTVDCKENPIYVLPGKKLRGLSPSIHIHVSVSNLYIHTYRSTYFLQLKRQIDRGNI